MLDLRGKKALITGAPPLGSRISMSCCPRRRAALIHKRPVIAEHEREGDIGGLAVMLPTANERAKALGVV
jgi:hypothetical protein